MPLKALLKDSLDPFSIKYRMGPNIRIPIVHMSSSSLTWVKIAASLKSNLALGCSAKMVLSIVIRML